MSDTRAAAPVVMHTILDGQEIHVAKPFNRFVYTRKNGSHYIITLSERVDVFLDESGTFHEYMVGHTYQGGIAV